MTPNPTFTFYQSNGFQVTYLCTVVVFKLDIVVYLPCYLMDACFFSSSSSTRPSLSPLSMTLLLFWRCSATHLIFVSYLKMLCSSITYPLLLLMPDNRMQKLFSFWHFCIEKWRQVRPCRKLKVVPYRFMHQRCL